MAKMYISWHGPVTGPVPINGTLISSEEVTITPANTVSATAPQGADYASVWADSAAYFAADATANAASGSNRVARPAGLIFEFRNIQPGITKIAGITI